MIELMWLPHFWWDNMFGFSPYKIQVTTNHNLSCKIPSHLHVPFSSILQDDASIFMTLFKAKWDCHFLFN